MEKFELANREKVETNILEVKKSKFIALVHYIDSQEMAEKKIQEAREEYKDARHVVYAYMLKSSGRFTDDKEPQGTAGKPIYSILEKENLINVLVIVIRYFGGILLGAGPLTRAYATVAKDALSKCNKVPYVEYVDESIVCEYKEEENIKRKLQTSSCIIQDVIRAEKVEIKYKKPKYMA